MSFQHCNKIVGNVDRVRTVRFRVLDRDRLVLRLARRLVYTDLHIFEVDIRPLQCHKLTPAAARIDRKVYQHLKL